MSDKPTHQELRKLCELPGHSGYTNEICAIVDGCLALLDENDRLREVLDESTKQLTISTTARHRTHGGRWEHCIFCRLPAVAIKEAEAALKDNQGK